MSIEQRNMTRELRASQLRNAARRAIVEAIEARTYFAANIGAAINSDAGPAPQGLAITDMDEDSKGDLIVTNYFDGTVGFLHGKGDGTFEAPITFSAGTNLSAVEIGQFTNGDELPDLAIIGTDLAIALGQPGGTFSTPTHIAVGTTPQMCTVAFLNDDANMDIAVANVDSNDVSILFGHGDGTFDAPISVPAHTAPFSITAADLDLDGDQDLAVANFGSLDDGTGAGLTILRNNGSGTFTSETEMAAGDRPVYVTSGDLNNDGALDLVVANGGLGTDFPGESSISVYLFEDGVTFAPQVKYPAGASPQTARIVDLDGDDNKEVVVSNNLDDNISVFPGLGDGTLGTPANYSAGPGATGVVFGGFNGDSLLDLAVVNSRDSTVSVFLNQTTPPVPYLNSFAPPSFGAAYVDFPVQYQEETGMNTASIGTGDVLVRKSGSDDTVAAEFVNLSAADGGTVIATYRFAAPGGTFSPEDNGIYFVSVAPGEVSDTQGNDAIAGEFGSIVVDVSQPTTPLPNLTGTVTSTLATTFVATLAPKATASVVVTNDGTAAADGNVTVSLFLSTDNTVDNSDFIVAKPITRRLRIAQGASSKPLKFKIAVPDFVEPGNYTLLAQIDSASVVTELSESDNTRPGPATAVQPAIVDLGGSFTLAGAGNLARNKLAAASVLLENYGNVIASGPVVVSFFAIDPQGIAEPVALFPSTIKRVKIKAGARKLLKLKFYPGDALPSGTYVLAGHINAGTNPTSETVNENNDFQASGTFTVP